MKYVSPHLTELKHRQVRSPGESGPGVAPEIRFDIPF